VLEWLEVYAAHCHEHAEQIASALTEARSREAVAGVSGASARD
jgi:hypothetical protein